MHNAGTVLDKAPGQEAFCTVSKSNLKVKVNRLKNVISDNTVLSYR